MGNRRILINLLKEEVKRAVPEKIKKIIRGRNKHPEDYFLEKDKIYLASADQFIGMKKIIEGKNIPSCEHFFSVIGGLGGLNILSRLENLKSITFFDINPFEAEVCRFYLDVIKNSKNRDDFISLIYLRDFDSSKYSFRNQESFYSLPLDKKLINRLKKILSGELYNFYVKTYLPHIKDPMKNIYSGVSVHCTRLPIFHEAPLEEPMAHPFLKRSVLKKKKIISVNSFFFGKGWLKNDIRFQKVKKNIQNCKVNIIIKNIFELEAPSNSGLYSSNVFDGTENLFAVFINKFKWILWYSKRTNRLNLEYEILGDRLIHFEKIYGKGIENPHKSCYKILNDHFDLNKDNFLEIIQPHIKEGMNFGFRHYSGQKKMSVNSFLKKKLNRNNIPNILGIHILMGNGCPQKLWKKVVKKAVKLGKEIFIFEHRKECSDFPEWDVEEENILSEKEIDHFLLSINKNWKKFGAANKYGDELDIRNICWILKNN